MNEELQNEIRQNINDYLYTFNYSQEKIYVTNDDWNKTMWSNVKLSTVDNAPIGISVNDEIKELKHRMSEMQTEINNLRGENQMLHKSLKDFIKELKEIINKKNQNNE